MIRTKMDTSELLATLEVNRDTHRGIFIKAQEKYREAVIAALDDRLQKARDGKPFTLQFGLLTPEDHTDDYDRVIAMVKAHQDHTIDLDEQTFAQLVLDDWGWKRQWQTTTASYVAS